MVKVDYFYSPVARQSLRWTTLQTKKKNRGPRPQANYTDRETAACRRSQSQLLGIEYVAWSAQQIPKAVFSVF
jgi:hypothetical protein